MRVEYPRRPESLLLKIALVVPLLAASFAASGALAETTSASGSRTTTLVVFAAHPIPEGEWTSLLDSMRRGAALAAQQTPQLRGPFEVLRGEMIPRGLYVDIPISVYLQGNCTLVPRPFTIARGTLGWVPLVQGRIEPFIHIECERLVDMLAPMSVGMTQNRRNQVMGEAITRVILHEWIHIATQNPRHAKRGVEKSGFNLMDLLADDEETQRRAMHDRRRKKG